ncbi:MAG: LysR family transcriptional regulator [Alphaproteobacteria bacterium]|nr:LysR family transcriptional regulator [Alphaproteobacteria bacterium]
MEWSDLRYVLAIARAGTLAAAARRLGVNQTTVARRLAATEADLGSRLFERAEGVLSPTEAGEVVIARAGRVEREVENIESVIGGGDDLPAGTVRVTATPVLANRLLIPGLAQLRAQYPRLRLEIITEARNLRLTRREADVALRLARPEENAALTKRVGQLDYAIYGRRRRAVAALPWISYEEGMSHLPQARWIAAHSGDEAIALLVNDGESVLHAVRAGLGKSLLPCVVGDRDAGLTRLGKSPVVLSREIWLLVHRDLRHQANIAAVMAWLESVVIKCCRRSS